MKYFLTVFLLFAAVVGFTFDVAAQTNKSEDVGCCQARQLGLYRKITPFLATYKYKEEIDFVDATTPEGKATLAKNNTDPHYEIYLLPEEKFENNWQSKFCSGKLELKGEITTPELKTYKFANIIVSEKGEFQLKTDTIGDI